MGLFGEVRVGEAATALLMMANLFLLMLAYYILKPVRESIVGGAELKSYASAAQAVLLMGFIPLYGWFASRVDRMKLISGFVIFFLVNLGLFYLGAQLEVPYLGFMFYVWLGIFNVSMPAQFWSYSNDLYSRSVGDRLFPIIAIGAASGAPVGAWLAGWMFDLGISPYVMMQISAGILVLHLGLYFLVNSREGRQADPMGKKETTLAGSDGFMLVLQSPYIRLIALMLVILNLVNTTGEYILTRMVNEEAQALAAAMPELSDVQAFIESYRGKFFADFFFWVNIVSFLAQALLASRMVKYLGLAGVMFLLPLVAFGVYGLVAVGVGFSVLRWAKTAENASDYSIMNTAKAMLWLPTSRQEKYKAKQAVDTFFVRIGDLLSAGLVFLGAAVVGIDLTWFALINLVLVCLWLWVTWRVYRQNRRLVAEADGAPVS